MNWTLSLVFSVLLLVGVLGPVYAQTNFDNVVINEIDLNPPGDDSTSISEWIELYNPTDSEIDLSGWEIASTTVLKKSMTISDGIIIGPGQFITYQYQSVWFTDVNEIVELRNENGIVIDKTPLLSDLVNDFTSWQRIYDGYDLDNSNDWKFVVSTAGSSNGKLIETQGTNQVTVTILSEKPSYLFGELAVIQGHVSEEVFIVQPFFQPESIIVHIIGPNFDKTVTLYPDLNLNYETTLSLHQVLGIDEGTYDVSVIYAGAEANTNFSVGFELIEQEIQESSSLSLITDKSQYLPGQTVSITGFVSEIIPLMGMKFTVTDSGGQIISSGNLYPSNGEFSTSVFLTTVNPSYGIYEIIAEYFDKSVLSTFEVVEDIKESVPISLWTDKDVYGVGDTVNITGRLNNLWVASLDLEIIQTTSLSLGVGDHSGGGSVLKILDSVRLDGDGKFQYSFTIPISDSRLGDYWIKINKDVGSATKIIKVVENPDMYVLNTEPLVITANKLVYDFNLDNNLIINGQILNPVIRTSYEVPVVKITISDVNGRPLEIIGSTDAGKLSTSGVSVGYDFTAIPESGGAFSISTDLSRLIFSEGTYLIEAQYQDLLATTSFEIIDDLKDGATVSIDKEVYGLGETVYLTGILPTSDRAVDISLTRPDGTVANSGAHIDEQRFSWTWVTPISEKYQNIKVDEDQRDVTSSNFGLYKIHISASSYSTNLFFKVSSDPENDSISTIPIFVSTEKSLYKAGEKLKVTGTVIVREQGSEGLVVPERVLIQVVDGTFPFKKIHESSVYPNQGGEFSSLFELPITIFSEGPYTVKVLYNGLRDAVTFSVANDFVFGIDDPLTLLVSTDKSEYYPGDTVLVFGKPNKLIYLEKFDVSVIQKSDTEINCGSFICGINTGPIISYQPSPSGSFTHEFTIPNSVSSIGKYEVTVDADFETKSIQFSVLPTPKLDTIIEKQNRIPETEISIFTEEKIIQNTSVSPRVLSGSLITPSRGDESNVNLRVSSELGICIIGPSADCLVSESTRKPGQIYDVVEVDGLSLNVRYSGPDVRLEKFSILPESSTAFLPDVNWNVEILKDEQVSRFYYKVTYKTLE
ncbi:MAG: lamin tail domain-containing protein [Nitrosopumilus sp.]|nr:lamin tail domain-containing protein [Nitrosopumilus sp.]NRA05588.1 lamin tail domain-containing protein [Nitrosopumilus sp.]